MEQQLWDKKFIFVLISIFLFSLISISVIGVKPSQGGSTLGINTLIIVPTEKTDYLKSNATLDFHIHVYNASGFYLGNQVNCTIHVYNITNNHILKASMNYSASTGEPYAYINLIDIRPAAYSYVIQCNATVLGTTQYGFYSDTFSTSFDGNAPPSNLAGIILVALFPMMFGIFIYGSLCKLNEGNVERDMYNYLIFPLKIGLFGMLPYMLLSTFNALFIILNKYWPFPPFMQWMEDWTLWFSIINWVVLALVILYILFMALMLFFKHKKEDPYERQE